MTWNNPPTTATAETDDQVFLRVKGVIARCGQQAYDNYYEFLVDNPTFEGYWSGGIDALRDNTVDTYGFGREVMIAVGRAFPAPHQEDDLMQELGWRLDEAANKILKAFQGPIPA